MATSRAIPASTEPAQSHNRWQRTRLATADDLSLSELVMSPPARRRSRMSAAERGGSGVEVQGASARRNSC